MTRRSLGTPIARPCATAQRVGSAVLARESRNEPAVARDTLLFGQFEVIVRSRESTP